MVNYSSATTMPSTSSRTRCVAVLVRLRFASGRDILYGIRRYSNRHYDWRVHIINNFDQDTLGELRKLMEDGLDGLIVNGIVFPEVGRMVGKLKIPTVVLGARTPELGRRTNALAFVRTDSSAAGALAARFVEGLGQFRAYAYVPTNQPSYASDLRLEGFANELSSQGKKVTVFPPVASRADGSVDDTRALVDWLSGLPRPAVLLAAFDQRALHVMEAASLAGLKVPKDLSVIGIDNDALLCEFTRPPLTSIDLDHVRVGEIMARELAKLMDAPGCRRVRTVKTQDIRLVERESAKPVSPGLKLVENALAYVKRNALKGIRASDVSAHLHVSRSLLDLRFREEAKTTVNGAILDVKLQEIKRLLAETSTPVSKITAVCGFKSENSVKNLFRQRYGCTMTDWRNRH